MSASRSTTAGSRGACRATPSADHCIAARSTSAGRNLFADIVVRRRARAGGGPSWRSRKPRGWIVALRPASGRAQRFSGSGSSPRRSWRPATPADPSSARSTPAGTVRTFRSVITACWLTTHATAERLLDAFVVLAVDATAELALDGKSAIADRSNEVDLATVSAPPEEEPLRLTEVLECVAFGVAEQRDREEVLDEIGQRSDRAAGREHRRDGCKRGISEVQLPRLREGWPALALRIALMEDHEGERLGEQVEVAGSCRLRDVHVPRDVRQVRE